jgi:hypothetical protein
MRYAVIIQFQITLVLINVLGISLDGRTRFDVLTIIDSHKLWKIPNGQRIVCEYNNASQHVGLRASKFRQMTKFKLSASKLRIVCEYNMGCFGDMLKLDVISMCILFCENY